MKNSFKKAISFLILFVMVVPFTFLFSGCGATSTNQARGVVFYSNLYDESTGHAIFEVDLDVEKQLTFKVNPSTWSGYRVTYSVKGSSGSNNARFVLTDGVIIVKRELDGKNFIPIQVEVTVNGHSDICIVRLKEYPDEIFVENTDVELSAGGSYTISPFGKFGTETRTITESEFNFTVESDEPTILYVPNKNRLKVISLRQNSASAKITVSLLNDKGEAAVSPTGRVLKFTLNFTIIQNVKEGRIAIDGYDKFIYNGDKIEINGSKFLTGGNIYTLNYYVFAESTSNAVINDFDVSLDSNNSSSGYVNTSENGKIIINRYGDKLEFRIYITTNLNGESTQSFTMTFDIVIDFTK